MAVDPRLLAFNFVSVGTVEVVALLASANFEVGAVGWSALSDQNSIVPRTLRAEVDHPFVKVVLMWVDAVGGISHDLYRREVSLGTDRLEA